MCVNCEEQQNAPKVCACMHYSGYYKFLPAVSVMGFPYIPSLCVSVTYLVQHGRWDACMILMHWQFTYTVLIDEDNNQNSIFIHL